MHVWIAMGLALASGFAIMVIEIVGARLLAKEFGSSFYVWTSQIGVVLVALTGGYIAGGFWADRFRRPGFLLWLLLPAGIFTALIPQLSGPILEAIVLRHPLEREIPRLWQKLDPAIGSALIFLPPCFVLAALPPLLIRLSARTLAEVGRVAGAVYGAGSAGSIAGVFASGYLFIEWWSLGQIFRLTGGLMVLLALSCRLMDLVQHEKSTPATDRQEPV
jgi:MFS family permease